jgi:hypothetical protein
MRIVMAKSALEFLAADGEEALALARDHPPT